MKIFNCRNHHKYIRFLRNELKANREAGFNKERLMDYFVSLGLEEKLYDKRVNEVSGGQRQRIMLAVTALLDKPLLVVDEPTSALDPESCLRVINFFKSLCSIGMTILSVSHDKQFAFSSKGIRTISLTHSEGRANSWGIHAIFFRI